MKICAIIYSRAIAVDEEDDVTEGDMLCVDGVPFARCVGIRAHKQRASWSVLELDRPAPAFPLIVRGDEIEAR